MNLMLCHNNVLTSCQHVISLLIDDDQFPTLESTTDTDTDPCGHREGDFPPLLQLATESDFELRDTDYPPLWSLPQNQI